MGPTNAQPRLDFDLLFESSPSLFLALAPDFSAVAASDAYLSAGMTTRGRILGRNIFDIFQENP